MKTIFSIFLFCVFSIGAKAQCQPQIHYDGCDLEVIAARKIETKTIGVRATKEFSIYKTFEDYITNYKH